jgi:hypothetical protein
MQTRSLGAVAPFLPKTAAGTTRAVANAAAVAALRFKNRLRVSR